MVCVFFVVMQSTEKSDDEWGCRSDVIHKWTMIQTCAIIQVAHISSISYKTHWRLETNQFSFVQNATRFFFDRHFFYDVCVFDGRRRFKKIHGRINAENVDVKNDEFCVRWNWKINVETDREKKAHENIYYSMRQVACENEVLLINNNSFWAVIRCQAANKWTWKHESKTLLHGQLSVYLCGESTIDEFIKRRLGMT